MQLAHNWPIFQLQYQTTSPNTSLTLTLQTFLWVAPIWYKHTPYRVHVFLWFYNISLVRQSSTRFRRAHESAHVSRQPGCIFSVAMAAVHHRLVPTLPPHYLASSVSVTTVACHSSRASAPMQTTIGRRPMCPYLSPTAVVGSLPSPDIPGCVSHWSCSVSSTTIPDRCWMLRHRHHQSRHRNSRCLTCLCRLRDGSYPFPRGTLWFRFLCPNPSSAGDRPRARPGGWTLPSPPGTGAGRYWGCGDTTGTGPRCTPTTNKHQFHIGFISGKTRMLPSENLITVGSLGYFFS